MRKMLFVGVSRLRDWSLNGEAAVEIEQMMDEWFLVRIFPNPFFFLSAPFFLPCFFRSDLPSFFFVLPPPFYSYDLIFIYLGLDFN